MSRINPKAAAAALATCAVACLIALPVGADGKDTDKAGPKLKGWGQVYDPDRDCDITFKDGAVEVKVPGTRHDFAADIKIRNSPRVLRGLKGDSQLLRPSMTERLRRQWAACEAESSGRGGVGCGGSGKGPGPSRSGNGSGPMFT
jgi:hypothetical protein